jgi:glutamate synthase (NADPH/NADH) large chain
MASEMGVLTFPEEKIVKKWRLQPGKMFLIDLEQGRIIDDTELKQTLATAEPYRQWIDESRVYLGELPAVESKTELKAGLLDTQQAFGYTQEDVKVILYPMAKNGEEPTGSMGNDVALPVLSDKNKPLYNYFKQLFAQVTNPPIDPIREEIVMSLTSFIGPKPNLMGLTDPNEALTPRLEVTQPLLMQDDLARLVAIDNLTEGRFKSLVLDITYPAAEGADGCEAALARLAVAAEQSVADGYNILILSDRNVDAGRVAIPALLACSGVHHASGAQGPAHQHRPGGRYRFRPRNPSLRPARRLRRRGRVPLAGPGDHQGLLRRRLQESQKKYVKAVGKGLNKVMSKMGISTYQSYCGAQIFEAVGLNSDFIRSYFTGTVSQVEGIGLKEVAEEAVRTHRAAFSDDPGPGQHAGCRRRVRLPRARRRAHVDAGRHRQAAARHPRQPVRHLQGIRPPSSTTRASAMTLRGLFEIKPAGPPVPLEEVESAKEIVKRFATGAMSLGSISTEAHSTLAIAMNRIGGKSNTGEGGEDPMRFKPVRRHQAVRADRQASASSATTS